MVLVSSNWIMCCRLSRTKRCSSEVWEMVLVLWTCISGGTTLPPPPPFNSLQTSLQCCGSRFTKPLFERVPSHDTVFRFVQQQSRALWWYCSKMVRLRLWGTELKVRVVPPICDWCLFVTSLFTSCFSQRVITVWKCQSHSHDNPQ